MNIIKALEKRGWFIHGSLTNASEEGLPKVMSLMECSKLYRIGINRLREICSDEDCPFVLRVGSRKKLVKTKQFEEWFTEAKAV